MNNWPECLKKILMLLATETRRHLGERNLDQDGRCLSPVLRQSLSRIMYGQADAADAEMVMITLRCAGFMPPMTACGICW